MTTERTSSATNSVLTTCPLSAAVAGQSGIHPNIAHANIAHANIASQPCRRRRIAAKTAIRTAIAARLAIPNAAMIGTDQPPTETPAARHSNRNGRSTSKAWPCVASARPDPSSAADRSRPSRYRLIRPCGLAMTSPAGWTNWSRVRVVLVREPDRLGDPAHCRLRPGQEMHAVFGSGMVIRREIVRLCGRGVFRVSRVE